MENPYDKPLFAAFNELADAHASGDARRVLRAEIESLRLKGLHKKWHFNHLLDRVIADNAEALERLK